jgi:hypothetical protein
VYRPLPPDATTDAPAYATPAVAAGREDGETIVSVGKAISAVNVLPGIA